MSTGSALLGSKPPSLRWRLQYSRLVGARLLLKLGSPETARDISRAFALLALVLGIDLIKGAPAALDPQAPKQAIYQWVVQLIIVIISALISYAMQPKPKEPERVKASTPSVEDGKGIDIICGTVWIEDEIVLGFKEMGTQKIKAPGGKK